MPSKFSTSRIPRLPQDPRYASLDLWRGIACVFVVIYHSTSVYSSASHGDATLHPMRGVATGLLSLTRLLSVGASIGIVAIDAGFTSVMAVLRAADEACYAAKRAGRGTVRTWRRAAGAAEIVAK